MSGFPDQLPENLSFLKPYWRYRESFYVSDGVILYNDRVVLPPSLRSKALNTLHSAHQGVSSMEARAKATVFWPGLTLDIDRIRASCSDCIKNAPSQSRLPPASSDIPSSPFEKIVGDFFKHEACTILSLLIAYLAGLRCLNANLAHPSLARMV